MASTSYLGYLGGVAIAVGVGAAIATAGNAGADTDAPSSSGTAGSSSSGTEANKSVNAGPAKPASEDDANDTDTRDDADSADDDSDEKDDSAENDDARSVIREIRKSAAQFEAEQVEKLRQLFTPREAAVHTPAPAPGRDRTADDTDRIDEADAEPPADAVAEPDTTVEAGQDAPDTAAASPAAASPVAADAVPWSPDPFRPDDPDPDDMPGVVLAFRDAVLGLPIAPQFKPFVREGIEAAYRGSQVVPWVNVMVPAYKILPALAEAAQGDRAGAQVIVNELLKTTGPVSLLYYGYDQVADLLNMEYEARALKEEFYSTVWDTLDPLALLHVRGEHGLRETTLLG